MKFIHTTSLIIGIAVGTVVSGFSPSLHKLFAQNSSAEGMSAAEIDKNLDEVIENQNKIKKKLEDISTQSQFLKASSGK